MTREEAEAILTAAGQAEDDAFPLLEAAIGSRPASLWVFVGNARARAFYGRHGFTPDGTEADDLATGVRELRMVR